MKISEKWVNIGFGVLLVISAIVSFRYFQPDRYKNTGENFRKQAEAFRESMRITLDGISEAYASPKPSASTYVYHEPTEPQKKYMLALGAIISTYNSENVDTLKSNIDEANLKPLVKEYWDITDRKSALILLEWLKNTGHRTEYNQMVTVLVRRNVTTCKELKSTVNYGDERDQLCNDEAVKDMSDFYNYIDAQTKERTLFAWDFARLVNVARWSYSLGYINEQEAWTYIVPAARKLQTTYSSWDDFASNYLMGRIFWMQKLDGAEQFRPSVKKLLESNSSPWKKNPWNTDLN